MPIDLSVIIPVYNVQEYIIDCIESVRKQTFTNYEAIIVSDGSTDESIELVRAYIAEYNLDKFRIVEKRNGGISSARNYGIETAKGSWIFFLDSDDWLEPECFSSLMKSQRKYHSDLVFCSYQAFDCITGEKETWGKFDNSFGILSKSFKDLESFSFCWGRLYKKSIIDENGLKFDERIEYCEDNAWQFDYIKHIYSFSSTDYIGYNYRINRNRSLTKRVITPQMKRYRWEHADNFIKHFGEETLEKGIVENPGMARVLWDVYSTAVINDILDGKYAVAKEKRNSKCARQLLRINAARNIKGKFFAFLWKYSFAALYIFTNVYYKNLSQIKRSKFGRFISKA